MDVIKLLITHFFSSLSRTRKFVISGMILGTISVLFFGPHIPYLNILLPLFFPLLITIDIIVLSYTFPWFKYIAFFFTSIFTFYFYIQQDSLMYWSFLITLFTFPSFSTALFKEIFTTLSVLCSKIVRKYWKLSLIIFTTLLVFIFYHYSFHSYFEGDEWVFFRFYAPAVASKWWFIRGFIDTFRNQQDLNVHMSPIANMVYVVQYKLFGLHFTPYLLFSLITHSITSLVVGWFVWENSHRKDLTITTTIIFASLATHSQAITWVVASVYTQFAVAFGLLSFICLKKYQEHHQLKNFHLSLLFLLLSLWSKETGITFFLLYPFFLHEKSIKSFLKYLVIIFIFFFTQRATLNVFTSQSHSISQPIFYSLVQFWTDKKVDLSVFRFFSFSLKMIVQAVIPSNVISNIGVWLSDYLFPYFTIEKNIRGTNYLMFIQTAMPEMVSLGLGLLITLMWSVQQRVFQKSGATVRRISVVMILLGVLPVLAITFKFPWWGYTAVIDARHFYHITPFISILLAEVILTFSFSVSRKYALPGSWILALLIATFVGFQYRSFQTTTKGHQHASSFAARKKIVETLQKEISPVPDKLVLFTTSNKSYYGFAQWMLPFQTAVSHMLPVLFSRQYHTSGQDYPISFFNDEYMKDIPGGLVTQSYFEGQGKGIGYFMEDELLIKAMEREQLPIESLYAFNFNGDTNDIDNITEKKRQQIKEILDSRIVFSDWKTFTNTEYFLTFQYDPQWNVALNEEDHIIDIFDKKNVKICTILVFNDMSKVNFSQFVQEQQVDGKAIDKNVITGNFSPDLDITRISYSPVWDTHYQYVASGNGRTIYQVHTSPGHETETALLFRTFYFED